MQEENPSNKSYEKIPFFFSINFRFIFIFVLLVAATVFLSGVILIYQSQKSLEEVVFKKNLSEAENVKSRVSGFLNGAKNAVELITLMPEVKEMDLFSIKKMMSDITVEHETIDPIALLNEEGIEIASNNPEALNKDRSKEEVFRKTVKRTYVSDVYFSKAGEPLISIASPILDYGNYGRRLGVLVAEIKLSGLWPLLDQVKVGRKGVIVVTDTTGRAIYHSDRIRVLEDKDFSGDFGIKKALKNETGSARAKGTLYVYMPFKDKIAGAVVIEQPVEEALYAVTKMRRGSILLLGISIFLAVIIGLIMTQGILQPLRNLFVGTKIVAEGDLTYQIDVKTKDEIGALAQSFNDMTKELLKQRERAITDELTNLYTHSYFLEVLKMEIYRSKRYRQIVSLLMLDIDHFKLVNDTYGHQAGDDVLINLSETLKKSLRQSDVAARYGGEELIVLAPETNKEGAYILADRIRNKISDEVAVEHRGKKIKVTVSVGVTTLTEEDIKNDIIPNDFLKRVDAALYQAKEKGRNCVVQI